MITFAYEDLTGIPNHAGYQILLRNMDGSTYGWQNVTSNQVTFVLPINKSLLVAVIGIDNTNNSYCNSRTYQFNTGQAMYSSRSTMSLQQLKAFPSGVVFTEKPDAAPVEAAGVEKKIIDENAVQESMKVTGVLLN